MIEANLRETLPHSCHVLIKDIRCYVGIHLEDDFDLKVVKDFRPVSSLCASVKSMFTHLDHHRYGTPMSIERYSDETLRNIVKYKTEDEDDDEDDEEIASDSKQSERNILIEKVAQICSDECEHDDYRAHCYPIRYLMDGLFINHNWEHLSEADFWCIAEGYGVEVGNYEAALKRILWKQNLLIEFVDFFYDFVLRGVKTLRAFYDEKESRKGRCNSEHKQRKLEKLLINVNIDGNMATTLQKLLEYHRNSYLAVYTTPFLSASST